MSNLAVIISNYLIEMSTAISNRISEMNESATISMAQAARDLASKGVEVINLSVGEPDFTTPTYIKDAAKKAIDDGYTFYTPVPGFLELRKSIAAKLKRDNFIDCTDANIVVSTGAKQSIANVILSLVNPGDEVLILAPYWVSYLDIVKYAEGIPVVLEGKIENDFKPTALEISNAITDKTKAIMFSSPSNPAGALFSKAELEEIANIVHTKKDLFVLSDEIYEYINYGSGHNSIGAIEKVKDQVITINGFSKGYAMTGWRVGYICAPIWLAKATQKIQGQMTSGTCSIAQRACIEALENTEAQRISVNKMGVAFKRRRSLIISLLDDIPNVITNRPEGAFYVFPDISAYFGMKTQDGNIIKNSMELSVHLLNVANVSTVAGVAFGSPKNIRISFAASDKNITSAIARIKKTLANLV